jgi:O-antigen/teichoic acid export membrane protein
VPLLAILAISLFILPILRGGLQGLDNFLGLSINLSIESILKLVLAVALVYIGFGVFGAMFALVIGFFLVTAIAWFQLKNEGLAVKKFEFKDKELMSNIIITLVTFICLISLVNIDVVLVKHFFTSEETGFYSIASLFGKILFFSALSTAYTIYPKLISRHTKKIDPSILLKKGLKYMSVLSVVVLLVYVFFSRPLITISLGAAYSSVADLLPFFGVLDSLLAIIIIFIFYNLSKNDKKYLFVLVPAAIAEPVAILVMHASLMQILSNLIIIVGLLFSIVLAINLKEIIRIPNIFKS